MLAAGFIREAQHPEWLSNIVLVKKSNRKWRMCIDFTDLNKACPKECFSLLQINLIVDTTTEHKILSFMDTYSRYNQIKMNEVD